MSGTELCFVDVDEEMGLEAVEIMVYKDGVYEAMVGHVNPGPGRYKLVWEPSSNASFEESGSE